MSTNFVVVALAGLVVAPPQTPPVPVTPQTPPVAVPAQTPPVRPAARAATVAAPAQTASTAAPASPTVSALLSHRGLDGSRRAMASVEIADGASRTIWSDSALCSLGTSTEQTSRPDAITWRVSARVLERIGDVHSVRFEWSRNTGATPAPEPAPSSRVVSLRFDEPVLLDRLDMSGRCGTGEAILEGLITTRSPYGFAAVFPLSAGRGGTVGGRGAVGTIGGGGGGRGGGGGANVAVPGATPPSRGGRAGGGGGGVATATPTGRSRGAGASGGVGDILGSAPADRVQLVVPSTPIAADLWLVHHRPDGTEQTEQQSINVGEKFVFKAVTVVTSRGPMVIEVSGTLLQRLENNVPDGYGFNINRRIRGEGAPPIEVNGGSLVHVRPRNPGEVVSIPIPEPARARLESLPTTAGAARGGRGAVVALPDNVSALGGTTSSSQAEIEAAQLLRGHRFEVRLRVR